MRPELDLVSVVVITRDQQPLLRYCLHSLRRQDAPAASFELVVVDDGSRDGTGRELDAQRSACALRVCHHPLPLGRAAARNAGLALAQGEVVLFLDGDTIAPPGLVRRHRAWHRSSAGPTLVSGHPWLWRSVHTWAFADFSPAQREAMRQAHPSIDITTSGPLLSPEALDDWAGFVRWAGGPLAPAEAGPRLLDPDAAPYLAAVTRDMSLPTAVARALGGFCTDFRGYGLEDWELGYRLAAAGVRFVVDPAAAVFHQEHPLAHRSPGDLRRNYAVFLGAHRDAEVALMALHPPWTDMADYSRVVRAYRRLLAVAPAAARALGDVALVAADGYSRTGVLPPRESWQRWTARWGAERSAAIVAEHLAALRDPLARRGLALLQRLTGLTRP